MERVLVYIWALPATLLGLVFFPLAWISGSNIHLVDGVLEISGGLVSYFLRRGILLMSMSDLSGNSAGASHPS
jgi:hypothetical protein